jgi:methylated-DNA-[protein]-cysteine S-methyltransferase
MTSTINGVALVAQADIDTPLGPLRALATARGLAGLWFDDCKHHPGRLDAPLDPDNVHIVAARRWFAAYWAGADPDVHALTLDPQGTPFQHAVWQALLKIPLGGTSTYGEIAAQAGNPAASRAAGAAIGRNPLTIVVPCHRVIGRDGSLTGYAAGLPRKEALLRHEGVRLA